MSKEKKPTGRTIKGKVTADVRQLIVKSNKKSDGYEALVDLSVATNEVACTKLFGEEFARLAFAQMVEIQTDEGPETVHLASSITAGPRFRMAKHVIKLGDCEVIARPEIQKITPIEKSENVSTTLRLSVYVGTDDGLGGDLVGMVGDSIKVQFSPAQQELPGV